MFRWSDLKVGLKTSKEICRSSHRFCLFDSYLAFEQSSRSLKNVRVPTLCGFEAGLSK
ncbi:hypothetical protein LEP1GSC082_3633 [Leptospira kirschneri str. H2]|nr:hypothetical protein LEP1GSC082_3633 [Leptospira kirschneri str. H2]